MPVSIEYDSEEIAQCLRGLEERRIKEAYRQGFLAGFKKGLEGERNKTCRAASPPPNEPRP